MDMLGTAERVVVAKEQTTIVTDGKQADAVTARIAQIRKQAEDADTTFDVEKSEERVAALGGGIARIKVGAATETELKDKKLRYEDALNSVKSAQELGIVPGGGACLAHLQISMHDKIMDAMTSDDERQGAQIILRSLSAPVKQIAMNAGIEGAVVLSKVQANDDFEWGWNAAKNTYANLIDEGVIDPAKVRVLPLLPYRMRRAKQVAKEEVFMTLQRC